ncbi:MAG: hypothetical protein AAF192_21785, partial [Pseudomonadota bacterium]
AANNVRPETRVGISILNFSRQRIALVDRQRHDPEHDRGDKTAWRLFNAATALMRGRVAEPPLVTRRLHNLIDGICETAA